MERLLTRAAAAAAADSGGGRCARLIGLLGPENIDMPRSSLETSGVCGICSAGEALQSLREPAGLLQSAGISALVCGAISEGLAGYGTQCSLAGWCSGDTHFETRGLGKSRREAQGRKGLLLFSESRLTSPRLAKAPVAATSQTILWNCHRSCRLAY